MLSNGAPSNQFPILSVTIIPPISFPKCPTECQNNFQSLNQASGQLITFKSSKASRVYSQQCVSKIRSDLLFLGTDNVGFCVSVVLRKKVPSILFPFLKKKSFNVLVVYFVYGISRVNN